MEHYLRGEITALASTESEIFFFGGYGFGSSQWRDISFELLLKAVLVK